VAGSERKFYNLVQLKNIAPHPEKPIDVKLYSGTIYNYVQFAYIAIHA
jgi:hypothetical protein